MELLTHRAEAVIFTPHLFVSHFLSFLLHTDYPEMVVVEHAYWERNLIDMDSSRLKLVVIDTAQAYFTPQMVQQIRKTKPNAGVVGLEMQPMRRQIQVQFDALINTFMTHNDVRSTLISFFQAREQRPQQPQLSRREIEVLQLLVKGKTAKEIGEELFISVHTVTSHRKNISAKLGIRSISAMAIYAANMKLIDPAEVRESPVQEDI
ncbi:MAG: response regulator transcription factor [Bacteroides sp.]|jgi:Response regulator containing a CheY-like receiver domain and an HTH DNA-binding domain